MLRPLLTVPLLVAVVAGCGPAHVQLPPPPAKDAPLEHRRAYYEEHRPMAVRGSTPAHWEGPGSFLILEDGTRVETPEDLLPIVEEASPTARATERAEEEERRTLSWSFAAGGLYGAGLAVMLSSLATLPFAAPQPDGSVSGDALTAAIGLVLAGGAISLAALVPMGLAMQSSARGSLERDTAFLTYDRSLRERLQLSKEDVADLPRVTVRNTKGALELQGAAP